MIGIRRLMVAAGIAATSVVAAGSPAGASTAAGDTYVCSAVVLWQVNPATDTATWTVFAGGTCTGASVALGPGLANQITTSTASPSSGVYGLGYTPVANTTAPIGAFAGVVSQPWDSGTLTGTLSGVNGVGFAADLTWNVATTSPTTYGSQVAHFSGTTICGNYCFITSAEWEGQVAAA
jgi:hypothetical protein